VARIESALKEIPSDKIPCRSCGGDLDTREGAFMLKYFLIETPRGRRHDTGQP